MKPSAAVAPYLDTLVKYEPFSEMGDDALARLLANARVSYHAHGETLIAADTRVNECWMVLQGRVRGERNADSTMAALELTTGERRDAGE